MSNNATETSSDVPPAPAPTRGASGGPQYIDKIGDLTWKGFMGLFKLSYGVEEYVDLKGRTLGDRLFQNNFSRTKSNPSFCADDIGEFFSIAGKGAYFGLPALFVIYFLGFAGALLCFLLFSVYFFFRARYIREEEKKEMQVIESLVAKEQK
ncbi:MAG: hypothetical protein WAX07_07335 [Candidatus Altiarchaeia archaeon]